MSRRTRLQLCFLDTAAIFMSLSKDRRSRYAFMLLTRASLTVVSSNLRSGSGEPDLPFSSVSVRSRFCLGASFNTKSEDGWLVYVRSWCHVVSRAGVCEQDGGMV